MKKIFIKFLIVFGCIVIGGSVFRLSVGIYQDVTAPKFPKTPYGMMLGDGCDPDKTFYRHTIAMEDYYVPWAAFHNFAFTRSQRYVEDMFLNFYYPDLSFITDEVDTVEKRQKKINVMVDDRSTVTVNKLMFESTIKAINGAKMPKPYLGFDVYDDPDLVNLPIDRQRPTILYLDKDWKDGTAFIDCSKFNEGCTLYVDKGRLSYRIYFRKSMFPEIRDLRDRIIAKIEGYKRKPESGTVLPEAYGNMRRKFKCQD